MNNLDFNSFEWHDSVLKNITINREKAGICDEVQLFIEWYNKSRSIFIFKDVYAAILNLNFRVVGDECIFDASLIDIYDNDYQDIIKKWIGIYPKIENELVGYEIITSSTNSKIKIFAKSFDVEFY
jgi:hypothetical protein